MLKIEKKRLRTWLLIALASLGVHYLMLILAHIMISGGFSFSGLLSMMRDRLTKPGDAERYLDIVRNGYVKEGENAINLVFYPLYPLLIRLLSLLIGNPALSGCIISQVSFAAASILLYELLLLDGDEKKAWNGVLLLSLYPFSMFVMGVFTEGLFLLLTIGCLYALRKENYIAAGIIGFFAALTRTQGMLLIFPAVYEIVIRAWGQEKRKLRWSDSCVSLIPLGFFVYLGINYAVHGNFFKFLEYEAGEPWYQTTRWIGENIAQHYDMAMNYHGLSLIIYWVQIALYFIALLTLFYGLWKKERISVLLYGGAYLGFTYLSGWMISGGRYMLCCVPLMMIWAGMKAGIFKRIFIFAMGCLFFAYSLFYLMGYAIM